MVAEPAGRPIRPRLPGRRMGTVAEHQAAAQVAEGRERNRAPIVVRAKSALQTDGQALVAHRGEIIGLAGSPATARPRCSCRSLPARSAACTASRCRVRRPSSPATARPRASSRSGRSRGTSRCARCRGCCGTSWSMRSARSRWPSPGSSGSDPHAGHGQQHPLALRRQPAEGGVRPGPRFRRGDRADGRPDARRRCRHQARGLRPAARRGESRPHLPLVHDGNGRAQLLRPHLRVPQRRIVADCRAKK